MSLGHNKHEVLGCSFYVILFQRATHLKMQNQHLPLCPKENTVVLSGTQRVYINKFQWDCGDS